MRSAISFSFSMLVVIAAACSGGENCQAVLCPSSSSAGGQTAGEGGSASSPATEYCNCMLLACHDEYHDTFGPTTDEPAAREKCLEEAASLPSAGMDLSAGNFVECRIHHCELGKKDTASCPSSVGKGQCQ